MNKYINIAGIKIALDTSDPVCNLIFRKFSNLEIFDDAEVDLFLKIDKNSDLNRYEPKVFSAKSSMNFNESTYLVDYNDRFTYTVSGLFLKSTRINVNYSKGLKKHLKYIIIDQYEAIVNDILSYKLFWYVIHVKLLQKNKSFIHACSFNIENNNIIISGTGGCGKTSALFEFMQESKKFSYYGEDFTIIDAEGFNHFSPKDVSIYQSDINFGNHILAAIKNKFSLKRKFEWIIKSSLGINPLIKVNPKDLNCHNGLTKSKNNFFFYLIRIKTNKIYHETQDEHTVLKRVLYSSLRELKTLNEILALIQANNTNYNFIDFDQVKKNTSQVCKSFIEKTRSNVIYADTSHKPQDIYKYIIKILNE